MKISLDLNKSLEKNAATYFDKAKKAKKKLEGAKKTVLEYSKKLEKKAIMQEKESQKHKLKEIEKNRKKFWFEKFKWFFTSKGSLVIAGKDAGSNEEVIKKYVEKDDIIFHTSMAGSPFAVLKAKKKDDAELLEVANFVFSHSKAWSQGILSGEAFYVNPDQVSKSAQSGEYISKGSFMVHGKRNILKTTLDLGIGILNYENQKLVMCAPIQSLKANCEKFVKLKLGNTKKEQLSKDIMEKLSLHTNDDVLASLPSGRFSLNR